MSERSRTKTPWITQDGKIARLVAKLAHGDQVYGGTKPYLYHLDMVTHILGHYGFRGEFIQAGFLHDVLEDTSLKLQELRDVFGDRVATLVAAVTGEGHNRKERNLDIYKKINRYPTAKSLKLADRIANIHCSLSGMKPEMFAMYRDERKEFEAKVCDSVPAHMIAAYTRMMDFKQPIEWLNEESSDAAPVRKGVAGFRVFGHALNSRDPFEPLRWDCSCGATGIAREDQGINHTYARRKAHEEHKIEVLRDKGIEVTGLQTEASVKDGD